MDQKNSKHPTSIPKKPPKPTDNRLKKLKELEAVQDRKKKIILNNEIK
jgi:hypothetical protein